MAHRGRSASAIDDPRVNAFGALLDACTGLEQVLSKDMELDSRLPHSWFEAMIRLAHSPGRQLPMSDLAREVALTTGGITRLIDRLAEPGYVTREPLPQDRRVQLATLTDRGFDVLERAAEHHALKVEAHFTGKLTPDELATLLALLDRINPRRG